MNKRFFLDPGSSNKQTCFTWILDPQMNKLFFLDPGSSNEQTLSGYPTRFSEPRPPPSEQTVRGLRGRWTVQRHVRGWSKMVGTAHVGGSFVALRTPEKSGPSGDGY